LLKPDLWWSFFSDFPGTTSPGVREATTLGGGTAISGGGTPDTGCKERRSG